MSFQEKDKPTGSWLERNTQTLPEVGRDILGVCDMRGVGEEVTVRITKTFIPNCYHVIIERLNPDHNLRGFVESLEGTGVDIANTIREARSFSCTLDSNSSKSWGSAYAF